MVITKENVTYMEEIHSSYHSLPASNSSGDHYLDTPTAFLTTTLPLSY